MSTASEKSGLTHTFRVALTAGAIAAALAVVPLLGGCASDAGTDNAEKDVPAATEEGAAEADAPETEAADAPAEPAFSPSDGIDDDGLWEGVVALDYVTLPEYVGIEVPADAIAVTDEEVQAQVDQIMSSFSTTEQVVDRAIADGDTVNIDYVGSIDGVEFDGGSTNGAGTVVTIGVTQYIDDFLEQLIGHKPGENFDIEVTFPDDYHAADLAGKDAVFNITVNYISQTVIPEATDEFVADNLASSYGWTTAAEMSDSIREGIAAQRLDQYVQNYVFDNAEVSEVPQVLVDYQEKTLIDYFENYAAMFGLEFSDALPMLAGVSNVDELVESNRAQVDEAARSSLVTQAVAEDAGIAVDDETVAAYFADRMGVDDITGVAEQYGMPYLKLVTLSDAVIDYLVENATVVGADDAETDVADEKADDKADAAGEKADDDAADEADAAADKADAADEADAAEADKADAADAANEADKADTADEKADAAADKADANDDGAADGKADATDEADAADETDADKADADDEDGDGSPSPAK